LAAISSGDIRSLLNIEAMAAVLQTSFSALAPWSSDPLHVEADVFGVIVELRSRRFRNYHFIY
jgi:hypothetical protein